MRLWAVTVASALWAAGCGSSADHGCSGSACDMADGAGSHGGGDLALALGSDLAGNPDLGADGDGGAGDLAVGSDGGVGNLACAPVAAGQPGSFALAGTITKMVGDRSACFIYALDSSAASKLLVFDTTSKVLVATIALPNSASDVDLSPNGKYLVVAQPTAQAISLIDKSTWTIASTISTPAGAHSIEVGDDGIAYYTTGEQWCDTHRIDLTVGSASDVTTATSQDCDADLELSADGSFLYAGSVSLAPLVKYGFSAGKEIVADQSTWEDSGDVGGGATLLAPGGQHVYAGNFQLDAHDLTRVTGRLTGDALAEDVAGTFVVSQREVYDAQLGLALGGLPQQPVAAAALTAADGELWFWAGGTMSYANIVDFLGGAPLGVRARPPLPLSSYNFTQLVVDPVRPRLYGLDQDKQEVVAIDITSGQAIGGLIVGSLPNNLSVSASGATLWVAEQGMSAIGKIDLASWQLTGFVPLPRDSYQVLALGDAYLATIDSTETTPALLDGTTGAVLDTKLSALAAGALAATADGNTLFVAGSSVIRYDVSTGKLVETARSTSAVDSATSVPDRVVAATPDGSTIFYGRYAIEGTQLATLGFATPETITEVTGDGRLAISVYFKVYRTSDGALLGSLPSGTGVRAITRDGKTLYSVGTGTLQTVDLTTAF